MAGHIHPVDIPPRYYKPLGQIAAGSNLSEVLIASIIWHFHNITDPKIGRLFTYHADFAEKLRIFKVTAKRCVPDPTIKAKLLTLYGEANELRKKRTTFVHGLWGRMPKEKQAWKVFYLPGPDETYLLKRKVVALQDLKDVAARVRKLNKAFETLMHQLGVPPP